jgi:hypothetical protein
MRRNISLDLSQSYCAKKSINLHIENAMRSKAVKVGWDILTTTTQAE